MCVLGEGNGTPLQYSCLLHHNETSVLIKETSESSPTLVGEEDKSEACKPKAVPDPQHRNTTMLAP